MKRACNTPIGVQRFIIDHFNIAAPIIVAVLAVGTVSLVLPTFWAGRSFLKWKKRKNN